MDDPIRLLHFADTEIAYDDPDLLARLAGAIGARRTPNTLVVGGGDNGALGVLSILGDGSEEAVPFLDAAGRDAGVLGNHDIDDGSADAEAFAEAASGTVLCANAGFDLPGAATFEFGDRTVGLIGVSHPETPELCPQAAPIDFRDPVPAIERETDALRAVGADFVVVLSHCGTRDETIAFETDVDAVLGGHDHSRRVERHAGTLAVRTAGVGTELAELTLGDGRPRASVFDTDEFAPEADVREHYRARRADLGADETVATVDDPLERSRETRLRRESRMGNFAADAYREAVDADIGLVPGGTIRTGPTLAGEVSVAEVVGVVPFEGDVAALDLSGEDLRATLADAGAPHPGGRGWVQFHLSGLRVRWDADGTLAAARVGGPDDPRVRAGERYRVATSPYLLGIDAFPALEPDREVAAGPAQYNAVLAHARDGGLAVEREGRIGKEGWKDGERV